MTSPCPTRALVRCDGAAVPAELAGPWDVREAVSTRGGDSKLNLVVGNLPGKVAGAVDPRVSDLVRIAAYCFAADRAVLRGGPVDVHREGWRRELTVCIPVADPAFWSAAGVREAMEEVLGYGTEDRWALAFDRARPEEAQVPIRWDARELLDAPDTVVLCSGGVDSLCALVEAVHQRGARPVVVSQWSANHIRARQERLFVEVGRRLGRPHLPRVSVEIHRAGGGDGDSSQRSRGFLFACLGAAVAAHVGAGEVLLADNGYVSGNPPINGQLVGGLASRGTHPRFLRMVNRLLARVFGGAVRVTNPLWDRTRAEALGALTAADCPDLLAMTHSCGKHHRRTPGRPHCGGCSQCVDRRFAVVAAGLAAHDPADRYGLDLFADALPEGEPRTVALSYVRFAEHVHRTEPDRLFDDHEELTACLDPDDPNFSAQALGVADVLARHAEEVVDVMARMYGEKGRALARTDLPEHALLRLWAAGGGRSAETASAYGVEVQPRRSRFARSGPVWLIDFRDEKGGLTDRDGTRRLARLLRASPAPLEALDLVGGSAPPSSPARRNGGALERDIGRTSGPGDAGTVLDEDAVRALRRALDEREQEAQRAEAGGEADKAANLRREHEQMAAYLRAGLGKGDRLRAFPEKHERARSTVSKTVWGQVDQLKESMPQLHAHLRRWVRLGYLCWYAPVPDEPWEVPP